MLGDGMVNLGVAVVVASSRKANASPKIVSERPTFPSTFSDGGANSIVPSSLRNCTCSVSSVTFEIPSSE